MQGGGWRAGERAVWSGAALAGKRTARQWKVGEGRAERLSGGGGGGGGGRRAKEGAKAGEAASLLAAPICNLQSTLQAPHPSITKVTMARGMAGAGWGRKEARRVGGQRSTLGCAPALARPWLAVPGSQMPLAAPAA